MTLYPWRAILVRPPDAALNAGVGVKGFQFGLCCSLDGIIRPILRLSNSLDAFLAAGERPRREVAVILHRIPAVLNAAHIGFVFIDVMGRGHPGPRTACWSLSGVPEHKAQWRADIILELWRIKHQHSTCVTTWWWRPVPVVFYFSFCRSTRQDVICS